ncbi:hypothetical protein EDB85DRAFT_1887213 [Lactarius pseudohatsudake]|nr:hypothetical protein EDB85DRAFT_1887213 [Lactarius pseudohatsudake]
MSCLLGVGLGFVEPVEHGLLFVAVILIWGCKAAQGVAQASARRELSYMSPWQSRTRQCRRAKDARKCGKLGSGYTECEGRVVGNSRKRSRTLRRGANIWISGRQGREHVEFESLSPRASGASKREQSSGEHSRLQTGSAHTCPQKRLNDCQKPNGCSDDVDWVDTGMPTIAHPPSQSLVSSSHKTGQWRV